MENRMVIVPWAVTDINVWLEQGQERIARWPALTGRICPSCGEGALVGHGQRQRSVHTGTAKGQPGPVCAVAWLWVQRVRCTVCGKTHTLLPAFLAPYQRHSSRMRGDACAEREAGLSWQAVLVALGLPMLSTTSLRRWVQGVMTALPAMAAAVAIWRAAAAQGMAISYGPVARPRSYAALVASVAEVLAAGGVSGWPEPEVIAGANWQSSMRRSWLTV